MNIKCQGKDGRPVTLRPGDTVSWIFSLIIHDLDSREIGEFDVEFTFENKDGVMSPVGHARIIGERHGREVCEVTNGKRQS